MRKIIPYLILLLAFQGLYGQSFRFNQEKGQEYRIVSEVTQGIFLNDHLLMQKLILNKIAVSVEEADESGASLHVHYGISEQYLDTGLYISSQEEDVQFRRDHAGRYEDLPADQYLPSVRHIPTFPDRPVAVGDSWSAMAEEVHDLLPLFDVDHRLHIPFRVFYTYAGTDVYQDRPVDVIHINYHFLYDLDVYSLPPGALPGAGHDLPQGVSGDFRQVYLWDRDAGIPAAVSEEFRVIYQMASGNRYIFRGTSEGTVIEADQWEKESVREMIEEVIEDENLEDVSVSVSEDGVVLTLENIHFHPDTARLLPGEEEKLRDLGEIIREFPEHDLLITGHTAFVGDHSDGQLLSEERASTVAGYFLQEGIKGSSEMIIEGMGSRRPVAGNDTEEGRRRNRRVEITILDN